MQFWAPQYIKNVKILDSVQMKATNLIAGLEASWEKRLSTPGLTNLEKGRLRGDLTAFTALGSESRGRCCALLLLF